MPSPKDEPKEQKGPGLPCATTPQAPHACKHLTSSSSRTKKEPPFSFQRKVNEREKKRIATLAHSAARPSPNPTTSTSTANARVAAQKAGCCSGARSRPFHYHCHYCCRCHRCFRRETTRAWWRWRSRCGKYCSRGRSRDRSDSSACPYPPSWFGSWGLSVCRQ